MLLPKVGLFKEELVEFVGEQIEEGRVQGVSEVVVEAEDVKEGAQFSKEVLNDVQEVYDVEISGNVKQWTVTL